MRQNTIETYDGNRWKVCAANTVLDNLMKKGCKVFHAHLMNNLRHPELKDEDVQRILENTIFDLNDITKKRRSETYYRLRRNIFLMCFDDNPDVSYLVVEPVNQDIVESTLNENIE